MLQQSARCRAGTRYSHTFPSVHMRVQALPPDHFSADCLLAVALPALFGLLDSIQPWVGTLKAGMAQYLVK